MLPDWEQRQSTGTLQRDSHSGVLGTWKLHQSSLRLLSDSCHQLIFFPYFLLEILSPDLQFSQMPLHGCLAAEECAFPCLPQPPALLQHAPGHLQLLSTDLLNQHTTKSSPEPALQVPSCFVLPGLGMLMKTASRKGKTLKTHRHLLEKGGALCVAVIPICQVLGYWKPPVLPAAVFIQG